METENRNIYNLEIAEVLEKFGTSREGLGATEVQARQDEYGPNALTTKKESLLKRLLEPFASVFVGVLLAAVVLSLLEREFVDATVIGVTVGVNALIFYAQQISVSRVLKTLKAQDVAYVYVLRGGQTLRIPSEELTYGDVVHVEEGMKVPADGRLIEANQVQADEALLTGESLPLHKQATGLDGEKKVYERRNMLFKGTYVKAGSGLMVVTGIGNDTELGSITTLAAQASLTRSPIERKIDTLTKKLIVVIIFIALAALALEMWRGIELEEALRFALVVVVSAVPEGLPVAITVVLLLSARRMAKFKALVKKISSVETMGAVTLIATDKTGTITKNNLSVADRHTTHVSVRTFDEAVRASLNIEGDHISDPLDKILAESVPSVHVPHNWVKVKDLPFDQAMRVSGVLWQHGQIFSLFIKGAPENVLALCHPHERQDAKLRQTLEDFTGRGYRTIAFAYKSFSHVPQKFDNHSLEGMRFDGYVGMADELRPKIKEAVEEANQAGIKVVMLTGDHVNTASYIARKVGIATTSDQVSTSAVLEEGNPEDIRATLRQTRAFGRVLPEYKYALLKATKDYEITAMTGDGVNDIPALVEADAGIAMGSGTDAAKDASDIVLLDDNFHTIVSAVRVGRTTLANIRKMIIYLLGTSSGEVLTIMLALLLGMPIPVVAIQILWINLVTDGVSVIPLGLSPGEPRQMKQPPRSPRAPLLNVRQVSRVLVMSTAMSLSVLWIFNMHLDQGLIYAQTLAFVGLIVAQWANAFNVNFEYKSWVYNFIQPNWKLWGAIGISIVLLILTFTTQLGDFLRVVPVAASDLLIAIAAPVLAVLLAVDLHKLVFYVITKRRNKLLV